MKKTTLLLWCIGLVGIGLVLPQSAWAKVRVITTTNSLKSITQEVGGEHVSVEALASPVQDPHFVDGRPSMVVKLNRADMLIHIGMDLEVGWLPPLVVNARNDKIQPGRVGNLNASLFAGQLLTARTGGVDRRFGDVHPGGNPHYLYDPNYGLRVAKAIAERLSSIEPEHARHFRDRLSAFEKRLTKKIAHWEKMMAPHRGDGVVGYHQSLIYLAAWLQLEEVGFVEPVPGISPDPRHLAGLILLMRKKKVGVVISEPWYNAENTRVVAEKAKATVVRMPGDVGAEGIGSYEDFIDRVVHDLHDALEKAHTGRE
jgi:zinc/manganese transport system substrate-binding protein